MSEYETKRTDYHLIDELPIQKYEIILDKDVELDFIFTTYRLGSGFRECLLRPTDSRKLFDEMGNLSEQGVYKLKLLRSTLDTIFELSGIKYTPGEAIPEPKEQKGIYAEVGSFQFADDKYANLTKDASKGGTEIELNNEKVKVEPLIQNIKRRKNEAN